MADRISDVREELVAELTKANGDAEFSRDMARLIEDGTLTLHNLHSDLAHTLARKQAGARRL